MECCNDRVLELICGLLQNLVRGLVKTTFLFNPGLSSIPELFRDTTPDVAVIQSEKGSSVLYPHQQYKVNPDTMYNWITFGLKPDGERDVYHVGEDSGYFMEGLPVHAIAEGIVTKILYDLSWVYLVAIQSNVPVAGVITTFYAHLSHYVDLEIGQQVKAGDKIGEIGPQETCENGGYKAHLHMGVAKGPSHTAHFNGYANTLEYWHSPVALIARENNPNGPRFKKVLFGK